MKLSDNFSDSLSEFTGKNIRVITNDVHYRGMCSEFDLKYMNVLLKHVVEKREDGWISISDFMLIPGDVINSIYIEKSFPFDEGESIILSVENGQILPENESE